MSLYRAHLSPAYKNSATTQIAILKLHWPFLTLLIYFSVKEGLQTDEQKYCRFCGAANSTRAAFCAKCGEAFSAQSSQHPSPQKAPYLEDEILNKIRGLFLPVTGKKILVGGVLLVLLIVAAGAMASPSNNGGANSIVTPAATTPPQATAMVKATATPAATATPNGQGAASDSDFSLTATNQGAYTASNPYEQPSAGDKYVSIYVELTNKNAQNALMGNQFQFTLFDNQNIGHQAATASFGAPNNLQSIDNSNPGDKTAGVIIFEIPAGNTPQKIVFEPGLLSNSLTVSF
jgi:hypothetical protein